MERKQESEAKSKTPGAQTSGATGNDGTTLLQVFIGTNQGAGIFSSVRGRLVVTGGERGHRQNLVGNGIQSDRV